MFISVINILTPEQPNGCPKETAPPFTLILLLSKPSNLVLAIPTTEKASLNSKKSISSLDTFAFFKRPKAMLLQAQW